MKSFIDYFFTRVRILKIPGKIAKFLLLSRKGNFIRTCFYFPSSHWFVFGQVSNGFECALDFVVLIVKLSHSLTHLSFVLFWSRFLLKDENCPRLVTGAPTKIRAKQHSDYLDHCPIASILTRFVLKLFYFFWNGFSVTLRLRHETCLVIN